MNGVRPSVPSHDMGPMTAEECELLTDAEASITAERGMPRKPQHQPSGRRFRRPVAVAERSRRRAVEYVEAKRHFLKALREGTWDLAEHPTLEGYLSSEYGHLEEGAWVLLCPAAAVPEHARTWAPTGDALVVLMKELAEKYERIDIDALGPRLTDVEMDAIGSALGRIADVVSLLALWQSQEDVPAEGVSA